MSQSSGPHPEPGPIAYGSTITILFTDIRGFTEFTDAHGDEAAYRMLQQHNNVVQEQIALYGGHVVKSLGDSFLVSFESARTAVTCAIAMQRAIEQRNRAQQGPRIETGIGINTGEPIRDGGDLFGGSVNLASRICAAAGPGRILISDTARHVVGRIDGAYYIDRGFFELKGFGEPQRLFEVDWAAASAVRARPASAPARPAEVPGPSMDGRPPRLSARKRRTVIVGAIAALVLLSGTTAAVRWLPGVGSLGAAGGPGGSWRLLRSDDFSDPARGLFLDNRRGINRGSTPSGVSYAIPWEYGYADGALVVRVRGPYPPNPDRSLIGVNAAAADAVQGDFAAEVLVQAKKSPGAARYGFELPVTQSTVYYSFLIRPGDGSYFVTYQQRALRDSRSTAINRGKEENLLRVEVRGSSARVVVNGQQVAEFQHDGLSSLEGSVRLRAHIGAEPEEAEVEVRFKDFKIYSLEP